MPTKVTESNAGGGGGSMVSSVSTSNKVHPTSRDTVPIERSNSTNLALAGKGIKLERGSSAGGGGGGKRKETSCKNWFLNAIYFICPDCTCIQCSTIAGGLVASCLLTALFLYIAGYWDRRAIVINIDRPNITFQSNREELNLLRQALANST